MTFEEAEKVKPGTFVRLKKQPKDDFKYGYFHSMPEMGSVLRVIAVENSEIGGVVVSVPDVHADWSFHSDDLEYVGELNG